MRVALCSFAGGGVNYRKSIIRLKKQAIAAGYFNSIYCFTDETAPASMKSEFQNRKDFYRQRGFGYWSWKPLLVEYALEQIEEGDILFYVDAGCQISQCGQKRFKDYVDFIEKNNSIFFHTHLYLEKSYTAKKIIDYIDVSEKGLEQPQVQATFFGLKKTRQTTELIRSWKRICLQDDGYFIDDANIIPVDKSFIDYRHDQSILSLLVKSHKFLVITRECHHDSIDYYPNSPIMKYPIHSVRNRTGITRDLHAFKYSSCRLVNSDAIIYDHIKQFLRVVYVAPKLYRFLKNRWKSR